MDCKKLNTFLTIDVNGEVKINPKITEFLRDKKLIGDRHTYRRIRRRSKVVLKTKHSYYTEVFSVNKSLIKNWARSMSLVSVPGLYSDLDLESGRYEGGFKVWESTKDLVKFLTEDRTIMTEIFNRCDHINVLELGGGAALPSMALLSRMIMDVEPMTEYRIHIQDYNWQVLASLTLINFAVNFPSNYFQALLRTKCLRFFCGDWKNFQKPYRYGLIMMSEVIYNCDNYEALHNALERHIAPNGYIILATKNTYFGLTGSLYSWLDFVKAKNVFHLIKTIKVTGNNIPRSIVIMNRIDCD